MLGCVKRGQLLWEDSLRRAIHGDVRGQRFCTAARVRLAYAQTIDDFHTPNLL